MRSHCNRGNLTSSIATRAVLRLRAERVTGSRNVYGELVIEVVAEHIDQAVFNVSTTCVGTRSLLVACFSAGGEKNRCPIAHLVTQCIGRLICVGMLAIFAGVQRVTVGQTGCCNHGFPVFMTACIDQDLLLCGLFCCVCICEILCAGLTVPIFDVTVLFAICVDTGKVCHWMLVFGNRCFVGFDASDVVTCSGDHAVDGFAKVIGTNFIGRRSCICYSLAAHIPLI